MLLRVPLLTLISIFVSSSAIATGIKSLPQHDAFIISRDDQHSFRGSHRIYDEMADGLVQVEYCGRAFWVRYATVAWTQLEEELNYSLSIELSWGKGWRPVCKNPQEQVTLKDLGVYEDPRIVAQNDGPSKDKVSRFSAISEAFKAASGDTAAQSFHGE